MKVFGLLVVCLCIFTIACLAQNTTDPTSIPTTGDSSTSTGGVTTGDSTSGSSNATTSGSTTGGGNNTTNSSCAALADCGSCTAQTHCVWCDNSACVDGFFYGTPNLKQCSDWRWKQCKVNGRYAFIAVLGLAGVILLIFMICICKCCCCQKKRKAAGYSKLSTIKKQERESLLSDVEEQRSSHPVTDQRRAQMREKWGIKDKSVNWKK